MNLYLLRHAEAGAAPRDEDRVLTEHGLAQARAVAQGVAQLDLKLATILCSPLPRAMQTALPVSHAIGIPVETVATLATGNTPQQALALLTGRMGPILLVGHEPQLSGIVEMVTDGRVHMRKAMLAWLEIGTLEPPHGLLAALLSWKHLARLREK